jgi:hypothetical protein
VPVGMRRGVLHHFARPGEHRERFSVTAAGNPPCKCSDSQPLARNRWGRAIVAGAGWRRALRVAEPRAGVGAVTGRLTGHRGAPGAYCGSGGLGFGRPSKQHARATRGNDPVGVGRISPGRILHEDDLAQVDAPDGEKHETSAWTGW